MLWETVGCGPAIASSLIIPTVSPGQGPLHNFQNPIQRKNVKNPPSKRSVRKFKMVRAKCETERSSAQRALCVAMLMILLKGYTRSCYALAFRWET